MIKIDHTLLSIEALDNLIVDIITRESTDYGEYEASIQLKKNQLMKKIRMGDAIIIYSSQDDCCNIINKEDFIKLNNR